ncbi:MAG: hypothetical protein BWX74_00083 [Tenericutes bacterium ADurb.Bin087]|nr:MAG: hypothetical protein BWX74_00083 [Tenericutes bacterium ADurb.Bin087]
MTWSNFAFLFLFTYSTLLAINIRYQHVNEVLTSFTHDHVYHVTTIDIVTHEIYFEKPLVRAIVDNHFYQNMNYQNYGYTITFYTNGVISEESERSRYFTINLVCSLGFGVTFDKTFAYYVS